MKVCFVSAGSEIWASARIRAYWPAQYLTDSFVIPFNDMLKLSTLPEADVFIWQKYCWLEAAKQAAELGRVNWLDLCDPTHWFSPNEMRPIIDAMNGGIVASNRALADDVSQWADRKVYVIPDRMEPRHYPQIRSHADVDPVRLIWFGLYVNRVALGAAWATLDRLLADGYRFSLTIYDDRPDKPIFIKGKFPIYYARWQLDQENLVLSSHDIALLPPFPGEWGKVKSNNKMLAAWANGLPVMRGDRYHDGTKKMLGSSRLRALEGKTGRSKIENEWHVRESARDWVELLNGGKVIAAAPNWQDLVSV